MVISSHINRIAFRSQRDHDSVVYVIGFLRWMRGTDTQMNTQLTVPLANAMVLVILANLSLFVLINLWGSLYSSPEAEKTNKDQIQSYNQLGHIVQNPSG